MQRLESNGTRKTSVVRARTGLCQVSSRGQRLADGGRKTCFTYNRCLCYVAWRSISDIMSWNK